MVEMTKLPEIEALYSTEVPYPAPDHQWAGRVLELWTEVGGRHNKQTLSLNLFWEYFCTWCKVHSYEAWEANMNALHKDLEHFYEAVYGEKPADFSLKAADRNVFARQAPGLIHKWQTAFGIPPAPGHWYSPLFADLLFFRLKALRQSHRSKQRRLEQKRARELGTDSPELTPYDERLATPSIEHSMFPLFAGESIAFQAHPPPASTDSIEQFIANGSPPYDSDPSEYHDDNDDEAGMVRHTADIVQDAAATIRDAAMIIEETTKYMAAELIHETVKYVAKESGIVKGKKKLEQLDAFCGQRPEQYQEVAWLCKERARDIGKEADRLHDLAWRTNSECRPSLMSVGESMSSIEESMKTTLDYISKIGNPRR